MRGMKLLTADYSLLLGGDAGGVGGGGLDELLAFDLPQMCEQIV